MNEYNANKKNPEREEKDDKQYTLPNEGYCSPEFPEGCIFMED